MNWGMGCEGVWRGWGEGSCVAALGSCLRRNDGRGRRNDGRGRRNDGGGAG